jgi:hypothetical protein
MSRKNVHLRATNNSDLTFDDMYYELNNDREQKAEALQVRRWRALKREIKGRR